MRALVLLPLLALTACNTTPAEPIVKTIYVSVPVTQPCKATVPASPVLPDETTASDVFVAIQRLKAGKVLLQADDSSVRSILQACIAPVKP